MLIGSSQCLNLNKLIDEGIEFVFNFQGDCDSTGSMVGQLGCAFYKQSEEIVTVFTKLTTKWDVDNLWIWVKSFQDTIVEMGLIDDDNCIVELVPQELEYLTIPNEVGTNAKAVLIGDYKVNQPKDGAIQRERVMQTPLLEKNQDKQAF